VILFATTQISLKSASQDDLPDSPDDWGGAPDPETGYATVARGIRAHLSAPSAQAVFSVESSLVSATYRLLCDPCDLQDDMRVVDEMTGLEYQVDWALPRPEPLAHVVAGLTRVTATA
jgi:hypothetical protein